MEVKNLKMKMVTYILSFFLIPSSFLFAAPPAVSKEAVKALQVARGKPCRTGVVFMDGKYLAPPYVVKRYGNAIMINDVQVTAPLVAWEDFVKTQEGVKITRTETPAAVAPAPAEEPAAVEGSSSADDDPLADLFDDEPKTAKKKTAQKSEKSARKVSKPSVTTTYAMEGEFVMNDASKALLEKINRCRTDVNARLMKGGFVFFGTKYSRVSGGERETKRLMAALPELLRTSTDATQLFGELRRNNFHYLTEPIAADLFRNRYLYPQIAARARQLNGDASMDSLLRGSFR